ncbi:MAG: DUF389 domain-containing protein [Bacteroidales bacterium]|nr:DUF389 domain-containing protein [Bacteroidales bacterium]
MRNYRRWRTLLDYINLDSEVDAFEKIHTAIEKDLVFRGTNLWILVFAIIIASVGLNMNSTAVIIGAMLISPLMGPINGMGYSIATYDMPLFRKALKNFAFAVAAGLLASTAYFAVSPISTAHSELLARTSPTIYDVLIAFFGGLAGIVAISSKQKGNVIPGVAIATALMPPLCTAGYGLATAQFNYFFGAFYLFTINTVFIAISSVVISQILKFPITTIVGEAQKKRINSLISVVITLVLIPSIYLGYRLVQKEQFNENALRYISNIRVVEGNFLLKNEIDPKTRNIKLIYGGTTLTELQKKEITERAADFSLKGARVEFEQGLSFGDIALKNSESETLRAEINRLNLLVRESERKLESAVEKQEMGGDLLAELAVLYPAVTSCSYSESLRYLKGSDTPDKLAFIFVTTKSKQLSAKEKDQIAKWLRARLKSDAVKVYFEE